MLIKINWHHYFVDFVKYLVIIVTYKLNYICFNKYILKTKSFFFEDV